MQNREPETSEPNAYSGFGTEAGKSILKWCCYLYMALLICKALYGSCGLPLTSTLQESGGRCIRLQQILDGPCRCNTKGEAIQYWEERGKLLYTKLNYRSIPVRLVCLDCLLRLGLFLSGLTCFWETIYMCKMALGTCRVFMRESCSMCWCTVHTFACTGALRYKDSILMQ